MFFLETVCRYIWTQQWNQSNHLQIDGKSGQCMQSMVKWAGPAEAHSYSPHSQSFLKRNDPLNPSELTYADLRSCDLCEMLFMKAVTGCERGFAMFLTRANADTYKYLPLPRQSHLQQGSVKQ